MKKNGIYQKLGQKKDDLKTEILAVWFAYRHPKTPWYAKIWLMLVAGYAFSPIDLIPDFIPVLGYLDDALILPLGIFIAIKLVPKDIMAQSRIDAKQWMEQRKRQPKSKLFILIVLIWLLIILVIIRYLYRIFF